MSDPIISKCEQGSDEWDNLRKSKLTASNLSAVLGSADMIRARLVGAAPEEGFGRAGKQAEAYELLLAAENGLISNTLNPSGLDGLIKKGIAEKFTDGSGCTLKRTAAEKHIDRLVCEQDFTPAQLGDKPPFEPMERGTYYEGVARMEFENVTGLSVEQVGFVMSEDLNLVGASPDGLTSDGGVLELKCPLPQNHQTYWRKNRLPTEYKAQVHCQMALAGASHAWFMSWCPKLPSMILKVNRDDYTENLLGCLHEFEQLYLSQIQETRRRLEEEAGA